MNTVINLLEKIKGVFLGILLLAFIILAIGYMIVNFSVEYILPIIIAALIFGIYQIIIFIFKL